MTVLRKHQALEKNHMLLRQDRVAAAGADDYPRHAHKKAWHLESL
jgi:hypothetical protein